MGLQISMLKAQLELHEKEFARLEATSGAKISELHALVQMERDKVRPEQSSSRLSFTIVSSRRSNTQRRLMLVVLLCGHRCVGMRSWRRSSMTPSSAPA